MTHLPIRRHKKLLSVQVTSASAASSQRLMAFNLVGQRASNTSKKNHQQPSLTFYNNH